MKPQSALLLAAAGLAIVVVTAIVANPFADKASGHALRANDAKVLAQGQQVYQTHCAACHGTKLEGQPNWRERDANGVLPAPPHDASGHTWHHPDEVLFNITKLGVAKAAKLKDYVSTMPVYEGVLSDEEIVAALSWIKSQWPAQVRERHDQMNAQARQTPTP